MIKRLKLTDVEIETECGNKILLMAAGGRKPDPLWLKNITFYDELWAVDMGIESCLKAGLIPSMLIGDCDSASDFAWNSAVKENIKVRKFDKDKDLTDFQLALKIAGEEEKEGTCIFLTGCFGGRFDHMWSTVISMLHFGCASVPLGMADDKEGMIFLNGPACADFKFEKKPEAFSVISFSEQCSGVNIRGTRWPLDNASLEYSCPYSISNRVGDEIVSVEIGEGLAGIYWEWGISCK